MGKLSLKKTLKIFKSGSPPSRVSRKALAAGVSPVF